MKLPPWLRDPLGRRARSRKRSLTGPKSRWTRLLLEPLEKRCLPAFISVTSTFINQTPNTLELLSTSLEGKWTDLPPDLINPGASVTWRSESDGAAQGTEGTATYQFGANPTLQTTLHWDDPFEGSNSFDASTPVGYVTAATGPNHGNNIDAFFALTLNAAARTFPPNSTSWTAIDPGAIYPTASPNNSGNPQTVSGRVTGLAVDPTTDTIYAATAGGGVWKDVSNSAGNKSDSPIGNSSGDWVPLTDNVVDSTGNPVPEFIGAIAVAPSNPQVIYAGTGETNNSADSSWGEGILVSQNGGVSWTLTGQATFLRTGIAKIVIDPQDPNTAWAAVCNKPVGGNPGAITGIFKTSNAGASWDNTGGVTPPTPPRGTAAIDKGNPWTDLVIDPTTTTKGGGNVTLYAAVGNQNITPSNGVYRSLDGGANWSLVPGVPGVAGSGRIALALSHPAGTMNATIYVSIATASDAAAPATPKALQAFDVSTDGGSTWIQQNSAAGNPANFGSFPNYMTKLGWYGNVVQADPNTPLTVYAAGAGGGGNTIVESTNGGATWTSLDTSPHSDHHAMAIDGTGRLLDGNDGGVWRLDSNLPGYSWEDLNGWESLNAPGLSINQISGIALSPAGSQMILTGSQDNGTNVFKGGQSGTFVSAWTNVAGNDGGFVRIDPTNTNPNSPITAFTQYQYPLAANSSLPISSTNPLNTFQRISDVANLANAGTITLTPISGNIGTADGGHFYAPYIIDPNSKGQRLVLGTSKLYQTTDQGGTGGGAGNGDWTVLGTALPSPPGVTLAIDSIAIAPSDASSKTIYVGASGNGLGSIFVSTDNATTWANITPVYPLVASAIPEQGIFPSIVVSPTASTTAYAVLGLFSGGATGKVWQMVGTVSGPKITWTDTDITGTGLPNVPVESILLVPSVNAVVVGTDVGVYATGNVNGAMTVWTRVGNGLPNVQVVDLQTATYSDTGTVVAAGTHGRGVWEIQVLPKVTVTPGGVLILSGPALGGSASVQLRPGDPSTLQVYQGATLVKELAASAFNQIQVNEVDGTGAISPNFTLTLDFSNGNPIPAGGLAYDGSGTLNAALVLKGRPPGGALGNEVDAPTGAHAGTLTLDASTLTYTNLTSFIDTAAVTNFSIRGTANPDTISITNDPNGNENGFPTAELSSSVFQTVDFANKTNVTVDGAGGANTFLINHHNQAAGLSTLTLLTGPVDGSVVNVQATPAGTTTNVVSSATVVVNVGSLAGTLVPGPGGILDNISGPVVITNSAGRGTLNADDTGSSALKTGTLTATTLSGLGMGGGITYPQLQAVNVSLGSGTNNFSVLGSASGTTTTINAIRGNNTINVGSTAPAAGGVVDNISGPLLVHGGTGTDVLYVDDTGSAAGKTGSLTATTLTGLGMAGAITYDHFQAVTISLGSGTNTLNVPTTHTGTTTIAGGIGANSINVQSTSGPTTVNAGTGNSTVNVGSLAPAINGIVDNITSPLTFNGGPGNDVLNVDDTGNFNSKTGTLTSTMLTGLGMPGAISYLLLKLLNLNLGPAPYQLAIASTHRGATNVSLGSGRNSVNVRSTGGRTTVNASSGNDIFNVGSLTPAAGGMVDGIAGPLVLNGGLGQDIATVDDTGSSAAKNGTLTATTLTGLSMAGGITYAGLRSLNINLGSGSDNLTITGTHGTSTDVNTGAGTDTINVLAINGNTLVQGGTGSDTFIVGSPVAATSRTIRTIAGPLLLSGGSAGGNRLVVTADVDFTLSDWNLKLSNGDSYGLQSIQQAVLTGGLLDNTFDLNAWTGSAALSGGGGNDRVIASGDGNFVLTDTSLTRSTGGSFTLNGITAATLSGGPGNNMLDATGFSGPAWLYGGAGNDTLRSGPGDDYLDGGTGVDALFGGAGTDIMVGKSGSGDTFQGGAGPTTIYGSAAADTITAGSGTTVIYSGGGGDTIAGGTGNDTIVSGPGVNIIHAGSGSNLVIGGGHDVIYGSPTGFDTLYGMGNDTVHAGAGNDVIFNVGGANSIDGGGPATIVNTVPAGSVPVPVPSVPAPPNWPPQIDAAATLPTAAEYPGRWTELAGSATGRGLSGSPGQALEPSIVAGTGGQFVAWADSRTGTFAIYATQHTSAGWQELAGSAHGGGVSATTALARRPSIGLNASGQPLIAYTVFSGSASDIAVASYDPSANGGLGGWVGLGSSLAAGGISGTGAADDAVIVNTASGPVVAWLDRSSGTTNVYVKQFVAGSWVALGSGAASGSGLSASTSNVAELTVATDGANVAVGWTQVVGGNKQIYLQQYSGGVWSSLGGSASGGGISKSTGQAGAASLAYLSGSLYVAWQDSASGANQVYAATFNGAAWVPAGTGAASAGGVSQSLGQATSPSLSANDGRLYLAWLDNYFPSLPGNTSAVYVKRWNGSAFTEEIPGDAQFQGVTGSLGVLQTPGLSVDPLGHPFVVWGDSSSGSAQVNVRGNAFDIGTLHYVNGGSTVGAVFTTATGSDSKDGMTAATPKASIQAVLDDAVHSLHSGDVILVDDGTYASAVSLGASAAGVLIRGAPNATPTISGGVTVTGAAGAILDNLTFTGGMTLTGTTNFTLESSSVSGLGISLNGGSANHLVHNTIAVPGVGVSLTGGVDGTVIENNLITAGVRAIAVSGTGTTALSLRGNRLGGSGIGIDLAAATSGNISGNDVTATGTGIAVNAAFTGLIEKNDIHNASVGVLYAVGVALSQNRIHDNTTGLVSTVADTVNGLGFLGMTQPNQIFANGTGVQLTGVMQNQHIYGNQTGVSGSGALVASDLAHANVIEANSTGVNFSGPIEFNRIDRNTIGIQAQSSQLIAHDLIYRNAQVGVLVQGQTDVRIFNNTLYTCAGDLVHIQNGSNNVQLENNIFWTSNGYDIYVANDSQSGFFSDYNDLYASGSGKLVYWSIDFTDLLDWQQDVYRYDLNSIGSTVVHPDWAASRFVALGLDNYQVVDLLARQRGTSPTLDVGDPLSDQALPSAMQNLLSNPGFESGLTGWTALPSGGTQSSNPTPWQGSNYYFAGGNAVTTLDQIVDLTASGFSAGQIDSLNPKLIFGGRIRSGNENPPDSGSITVTFYDGSAIVLHQSTASASNTTDRWELVGGQVSIPTGARTARFRFTAVRASGSTNDSYLDGAFLYVLANAKAPDQGAYGNTAVQTARAASQHLVLRSPDLYTDWLRDKPLPIRWDSLGNVANAPVRIDLIQGSTVTNITPATPDTGEFDWIAANSSIPYGAYGLRIQISLVGNATVVDRSQETFTVPENNNSFFVNDAAVQPGDITSVPGSNRNDGKLASTPKPYPNNVLRIYTLGPTQTLSVDAGDYRLLAPVVLSGITGIGDDRAFTLTGPTDPGRLAVLHFANPLTVAPILELNNADFMTLQNLSLQNGQFGVWAHNNSSNLTVNNLTLTQNSVDGLLVEGSPNLTLSHVTVLNNGQTGIQVQSGSSALDLGYVTASGNGSYGIYVRGAIGRLHDSTVSFNGLDGLNLLNPGGVAVESSTFANNGGAGIWVEEDTPEKAVLGNPDLSKGLGNVIRNNSGSGIVSYGKVLVAGNVVSGSLSANAEGIFLSGEAIGNVVFNNQIGIYDYYGTGLIHENRVYDNVGTGIYADGAVPVYDNVVYSNAVGLQLAYSYSAAVNNNLIYANTIQGLLTQSAGSSGAQIANNTIYQPQGDAIALQSQARNIQLRNNILWVESGYDLSVSANSQAGFVSDYNLLYTTGTGQVGLWQGVPRASLTSWRSADFTDQNSLAQDPLFVNSSGAGGFLGYRSPSDDGRDDDFHEQSTTGSFHGGALAPVISLATGLPAFPAPTLAPDGGESAAIDRGNPTDSSSAEPAPNGAYINLGAYGGTAQASLSPTQYLLVTSPAGGEVWPQQQSFTIVWRNSPISDVSPTVDINLLRAGNPVPVLTIATGSPNTGQFFWTIPTSIAPSSSYLIQVTSNQHAALTGASAQPFSITAPTNVYYVNDGSVNPGDWTSAPGNDSNDGLTAATPKASIGAILSAYHLNPMDVIKVDAGTYNLSSTILLGAAASGITIEGNPDPARPAVLDRGNTSTNVIDVEGAVNVTLDHLQITGGATGIVDGSSSPSTGLTVSNSTIFANFSTGIFLGAFGDHATLTGNTIYGLNNQATDIEVRAYAAILTGNTVHDSRNYGIFLSFNDAHATLSNNNVYANGLGIYASSDSANPADLTTISGNTIHDNSAGITAGGNILITGNTVYGNTGYQQAGILAYGGVEVRGNVAHDNYWGIYGFGNGPGVAVTANTVYNNNVGIIATYAPAILNNLAYANTVGLQLDGFSGQAANNLVYGNTAQGFLITNNYYSTTLSNNTVYQPAGNAIEVQSSSKNVVLRNNILWALSGYDITVASNSEQGFQSDYNDLYYTTASASLGSWGGVSFSTLVDWSLRLGFDHHSLSVDPLFVNLAGLDFRLQGGSPAIDHGDPSDAFFLEPAPNGGRIDLGAYGNTPLATPSPAQELQVLSPNGLEKLQIGQTVPITWRTAGLYGPADYYSNDILADHPLAYYRLGEASGTTAADASGNHLNGTYKGVQLGNPGALPFDTDTAAQLDGSSGYVQLPSGFADFTGGFTAELWTNPSTAANYQIFFELGNGAYSDDILLYREGTSSNLLFQTYSNSPGAVVRATNAIELNKWQLFTITMDGLGNVALYKNGALLVAGATAAPRNVVRSSNYLGKTGFGYPQYAGRLDEVAFYGTALSAARVQDHYAHSGFGTVNIDLLQGGTVTRLATGVPDSGSYLWTIPATVPTGGNYQIRVTANDGVLPSGLSSQPFLIANGGHSFYLDPAGDNANSGKSPDQPMASLSALLTAYSPHAGDTVYVAAGTYNLLGNVVLGPQESGLHIVGPGSGPGAIFNRGNTSAGSYVFELQGATDVLLDHLGITGGLYGLYAAMGSGSAGLTVSNSTLFTNSAVGIYVDSSNDHATIVGNTVYGQVQGIIDNAINSLISLNTVYGSISYGIYVSISSANSTVSNNDVSTSGTGIYVNSYGTAADFSIISGNTVHNNSTGINASGSVLISGNTVYGQTGYGQVGISIYGVEARGNIVHDNYYGISAYANIAPIDGNTVYNNTVGILAQRESPVLQNRVYGNGVGIQLDYFFDRQAANNLVYGNTSQGILVTLYSSPTILNNTVYQATGDAIQIQGSNTNVVLRNNILWAQAGYDLSVAPDSEQGFKSDYNLFYTTASGKLFSLQGKDLLTLPDWIYQGGQDSHGLVADPQFVNLAGLDFRLQGGSPAIDRGDPSDPFFLEPAPNGGRIDVGAYGNTPLATPSPAQELQVLSPNGLEKLQTGQAVPITWRTAGLFGPADYYSSDILTDHPLAYYRLGEASGTTAADASGNHLNGTYTGGVQLGNPGALPFDTNTAAQLDGSSGYVQLPSGFADFTGGFTAELWLHPTTATYYQVFFDLSNGAYSDNILLQREGTSNNLLFQTYTGSSPGPVVRAINAIEPNQWQLFTVAMDGLGNVSLYKNAALLVTAATAAPRNLVRTSNYLGKSGFGYPLYAGGLDEVAFYGTALSAARVQDHYAHRGFGTVNIDLVPGTGAVVNIATNVPDSGSYTWTIPAGVSLGSGYRVQITANDGTGPSGLSSQPFLITNGGHSFYLDPAGDNANSGKSPDQPMATLSALIAAYSPHAGDTVYVAGGAYNLLTNVVLGSQNSGLHIVGSSTGPGAIFNRGNSNPGIYGFELRAATNIILDHLGITGGVDGVYAANGSGSTGLMVSNSAVFANSYAGIFLDASNDQASLIGDTLYGVPGNTSTAQVYGIFLNANNAVVSNNTVYSHSGDGILAVDTGTTLSGNLVYGNATGIYAQVSYSAAAGDRIIISGNIIHDNTGAGIDGGGNILVIGNIVYGQSGPNAVGLQTSFGNFPAEFADNDVHGNTNGIVAQDGFIHDNRVYNNSAVGITDYTVGYAARIVANQVYSNNVGILGTLNFNGLIANNLVYANTTTGILLESYITYPQRNVINNTVYQISGSAVRIDGATANVKLRNNILWVQAGYDIYVADDSHTGFSSDYNLLHTGADPNAHVGFWNSSIGGGTRHQLSDWQTATTQDGNSGNADPKFVDLDGADNLLGYTQVSGVYGDHGRDDNFYLAASSPAIVHGDSVSAPATDIEGYPRKPGLADLGAYAFRGDPALTTPPTVVGTAPAAIDAGGSTSLAITTIAISFSKDVNPIDADAAAVYDLRKAGSHGFGSADDVVYVLTPHYTAGSDVVTVNIAGLGSGGLPTGNYQLTLTSNANTSIHDLEGLRLDGNADGLEGGDYVRTFVVLPGVTQSGSGQSALVNTAFANPLVITIADSSGNPVPNVTVSIAAPGGGASGIFSNSTVNITGTTNSLGQISETFTANTVAGSYTVMATVMGFASPFSFSLTNLAGPISQFLAAAPGGPAAVAGHAFLVVVQAADMFGNPITSYGGPSSVTANINPASPGSSFPTTVAIDSHGLGLFLANVHKVGSYTITLSSGTFTGAASPVTVTAGPAVKLSFGTQPANTPTGNLLPTVTVQVLDLYGNVITTDNTDFVTLRIATGPGSFRSGSTLTATVHNGVASFDNLTLIQPGSYALSAVVPTLFTGPNSNSFTVLPLQVVPGSFVGTPSGFSLQFNTAFLVSSVSPVLYGAGFGSSAPAPSVIVTTDPGNLKDTAAYITGSLVLNAATNTITFVETDTTSEVNNGSPILPNGTYTVIVRGSAAGNGFRALNSGGGLLDGRGIGTPGSGDYIATFTVNAAGQDVLWIPATAEGPGQTLNDPGMNQAGGGYPVYLSDHTGMVTKALATLDYDPTLLTVNGVTGAGFSLLSASGPGHAVLQYSGPALPAGTRTPIGFLTATVPSGTAASPTPYKAKNLLHLSSVSLNSGAIPVATSDALHLVAYVGDADGNGGYSSNDAVLITRVALQTDSGLAAYPLVDPVIVADTDGAGFIPADAALQANEAGVGFPTANLPVPPIPVGVVFQAIANNVDPSISIPSNLQVGSNGTITLPVNIDDAHPAGSTGLIEAHLALTYDPRQFTVSAADVHAGSVLAGGGWNIVPTIDQSTGQIGIALSSTTPISNSLGGSLVTINFHPIGTISVAAPFELVASASPNGQYVRTELEDAQGTFTLSPAPTNSFDPRIDGVVMLMSAPAATPVGNPGGQATTIVSATADDTQPADGRYAEGTVIVESVGPGVDLETGAQEAVAVPSVAAVHASETPHGIAISASSLLASMTASTSANLLGAFMFQVGGASLGLPAGPSQRLGDQFFRILAHTINSPANATFANALSDSFERALAGQLIPVPTTADSLGNLNWEEFSSGLDWQGAGDPGNCGGQGDSAVHHADQASLDECFSQMAAGTDQAAEDE